MPKPPPKQSGRASENVVETFFREARRIFGEQYRVTGSPSVVIARAVLEHAVEADPGVATEALKELRDPSRFATLLLNAEADYQRREDQRLHKRMAALERNTHWKAAAAVSMGTGIVLGLAFAVSGPFFNALLQPAVDEIFGKKQPSTQTTPAAQYLAPSPRVTNNTYYFVQEEKSATKPPKHHEQAQRRPTRHVRAPHHKC